MALITAAFAARFLRGQQLLGSRLQLYEFAPTMKDPPRTIVGVVGDVKSGGFAAPPVPVLFLPIEQVPDPLLAAAHSA